MLFESLVAVLMSGLVTHVGTEQTGGPDVKRCAALAADRHQHHEPRLIIEGAFTESGDAVDRRLLPGDRLELLGIDGAGATPIEDFCFNCTGSDLCELCELPGLPKFRQFVPTLTEPLTQSLLDDDVRDCKPHDNVVAYLMYPAGVLFNSYYHDKESKYVRGGEVVRSQCVPQVTGYIGIGAGAVILRHHGTNAHPDIPLAPLAVVTLINQADSGDPPDDVATAHFRNYGGLLKRRYFIVPRRTASITRGNNCTENPKLKDGTTVDELPDIFLAQYVTRFATAGPLQSFAAQAAQQPTSKPGPHIFRTITFSEHPACTNTAWP